jgi:hypothetical protein
MRLVMLRPMDAYRETASVKRRATRCLAATRDRGTARSRHPRNTSTPTCGLSQIASTEAIQVDVWGYWTDALIRSCLRIPTAHGRQSGPPQQRHARPNPASAVPSRGMLTLRADEPRIYKCRSEPFDTKEPAIAPRLVCATLLSKKCEELKIDP